jgi:hypothetical protein
VTFQKKKIEKEERLKFFKGHGWQTKQIFVSIGGKRRPTSIKAIINKAKEVIAEAERPSGPSDENSFSMQFVRNMTLGPKWCREVISKETEFVREGPLALAKEILLSVEKINHEDPLSQTRQPNKTLQRTAPSGRCR